MSTLNSIFEELKLDITKPNRKDCLYRSGFLDSADLLQLLLLIEQSISGNLCLEDILSKHITIELLESLLDED